MPTVPSPWFFEENGAELLCEAPDWTADNLVRYRTTGEPVTGPEEGAVTIRTGPDEAMVHVAAGPGRRPGPAPEPVEVVSLTSSPTRPDTWFPCALVDPDRRRIRGRGAVLSWSNDRGWLVRFIADDVPPVRTV